ncbi:MAG: hypothetical protein IIW59_07570 [Alistipes sp.]|nr:hypothetical protein [Alistipes sp.]
MFELKVLFAKLNFFCFAAATKTALFSRNGEKSGCFREKWSEKSGWWCENRAIFRKTLLKNRHYAEKCKFCITAVFGEKWNKTIQKWPTAQGNRPLALSCFKSA